MFDRFGLDDTYCILCWVREAIHAGAQLNRRGIRIKGKTYSTLAAIERTHKVAFGW